MKVTLKKKTIYTVETEDGFKLGEFCQQGESWNGLINLRTIAPDYGIHHSSIICTDEDKTVFSFLSSPRQQDTVEAEVVRMSQNLIDAWNKHKEADA